MIRRTLAFSSAIMIAVATLVSCASTLTREELAVEYFNLGTAYYEIGDLERSGEYLSRAIQLDETLARASYNLARVYVQQGRFADADDLLAALTSEDPANTVLLATQGYVAYLEGDAESAAAFYDRAIAEDPGDASFHLNRAIIAEEGGEFDLAVTLLRTARELQPGNPQILKHLGTAEWSVGDADSAIETFLAYIDRAGSDGEVELLLAELYQEGAYYDRALELLDAIVERGTDGALVLSQARFRKAAILLTAAEESELGIAALQAALSGGLSNADEIERLLQDDRLIERAIVEQLLRDADLLADSDLLPTTEGTDSDATGPSDQADQSTEEHNIEPPPVDAQ